MICKRGISIAVAATYMNAEKFRSIAGIDAVHVPYKGSPEAITETMTGRVDYFFAPLVSALPLIKDGRLLALAVGTSKRSALLADVRERLAKLGAEPFSLSPEQFDSYIKEELAQNAEIIKAE